MTSADESALCAGTLKLGVRWNTNSCFACRAISGIDWIADEPDAVAAPHLAGEVDTLVRPVTRVIALALEGFDTLDFWHLRG